MPTKKSGGATSPPSRRWLSGAAAAAAAAIAAQECPASAFVASPFARPPTASASRLLSAVAKRSPRGAAVAHEPDHHGEPDHREWVLDLSHYGGIRDFNSELDVLAGRCVDDVPGMKEDVIGCAALAEDMLHKLEKKVEEADDAAAAEAEGGGEAGPAAEMAREIMRPDVVSYNTVIKAWSRACATLGQGRGRGTIRNTIGTDMAGLNVYNARDAAARATSFLTDLESRFLAGKTDVAPEAATYNGVIDAWAKSRCHEASEKAEELLERMIHLSKGREGGGSGKVNFQKEKWEQVQPDIITYNAVIEAWAHSPDPQGLEKAASTLDMLEEQYEKTSDPRIKPNIRTVNQVINAYAKKGTDGPQDADYEEDRRGRGDERAWAAARKAERLLNGMLKKYAETGDDDYRPDATTYTSCCDAYSRVGDAAASERAERLLERMEGQYNETGDASVKPNFRTYTAVITAWAKTPDEMSPHRAERLLRRMELLHAGSVARGERVSREESVKPNVRTYTTVINAWVRSRDNAKPQRALRILKKMIDLHKHGDESVKPNLYTYNSCMEACAKCRGTGEHQAQALRIAFAVNKALAQAKGVEANHITYSILMKCASKLMPPGKERNDVARAVFEKCFSAGLVNESVLRQLQMAADRNLFYELCKPLMDKRGRVDFNNVPQEWKKNVR